MTITQPLTATRYESNSATSAVVPVPTGVAAGDVLIAAVSHSQIADIAAITGWTAISVVVSGTGTGSQSTRGFYRVATAAEPASYTWATSATAGRVTGIMQAFRGVDTTTPLDATPSTVTTDSTATSATLPAVTPVTASTVLVSAMSLNSSSSFDLVAPTGMTIVTTTPVPSTSTTTAGRRTHLATQALTATGGTGTRTWTQTPTTTALQYAGWMVPLRPAATGGGGTTTPTAPEGIAGTWALDFNDDFDGTTLDTTKWRPNRFGQTAGAYTKDEPFNTNLNGAGYITEAAYFDPTCVTVTGSQLALTVDTAKTATLNGRSYPFASGTVSTEGLYNVPDGAYVEARIFIPTGDGTDGTGLWPAFWSVKSGQWPPEIDVFEFFNTADTQSPNAADAQYPKFNYHYNDASGTATQTGSKKYGVTGTDYRGTWHTYGVLRSGGKATPYVDGVAYPNAGAAGMVDALGQFIILNLSVYREWYGAICAPRNGAQMKVDWVRVWKTAAAAPVVTSRMVGIPTGTTARVATRTTGTTSVRLKVGTDTGVTQNVVYGPAVTPDANGASQLTVTGLTAGTRYYYRLAMTDANGVEVLDTQATVGTFKTAPTGATNFAFNFGACTNATDSASMAAIATRGDDLFIHLGDMWYADATGTTVANFRTQMGSKLAAPNHHAVFATTPTAYTPSDHDFSMNNNGTGLSDTTARDNYNSVYRQYIPTPTLPTTLGLYYTFVWGRVRFISMDTRTFKSNPADTDNATKTALGSVQKQWLKDTITAATEPVTVIMSEAPWAGAAQAGDDGWFGYTTERAELASFIQGTGKKVVIIAGDMHALAADDGTNSPGGIPVLQAAPMNNAASQKGGPYTAGTYPATGTATVQQYGRVAVTDNGSTVTLAYTGYSSDNTARITQTVTAAGAAAATNVTLTGTAAGTTAGATPGAVTAVSRAVLTGAAAVTTATAKAGVAATNGSAAVVAVKAATTTTATPGVVATPAASPLATSVYWLTPTGWVAMAVTKL